MRIRAKSPMASLCTMSHKTTGAVAPPPPASTRLATTAPLASPALHREAAPAG